MTDKERKRIEARLQEERDRAQKTLAAAEEDEEIPQSEAAGDISRFPTHMADEGTNTEEQEKDFMIASKASDMIVKIDDALQLLYGDPERFEKCENCGKPIEMERLDLIPWTRVCSACAASSTDG